MRIYEPPPGETIEEATERMVALANETNETVEGKFNDTEIMANPGDNPNTIVSSYYKKRRRRR